MGKSSGKNKTIKLTDFFSKVGPSSALTPSAATSSTQPSRQPPSPLKQGTKRKRTHDSASDYEDDHGPTPYASKPKPSIASKENIPAARRPPRSPASPPKVKKLSPKKPVHYIPSSQSDEQELLSPYIIRDTHAVKNNVQQWRKTTVDFTSYTETIEIDSQTQPSSSSFLPSPVSDDESSANQHNPMFYTPASSLRKMSQEPNDYMPMSPPPSDSPQREQGPSDIIARMKAEAAAEAAATEAMDVDITFSGVSSDEDDEEIFKATLRTGPGSKPNTDLTSPTTRRRSSRLVDRKSAASTYQPLPVTITTTSSKKRPRKSNPLEKMLREQQRADKGGYGAAMRQRFAELDSDSSTDMDSDSELEDVGNAPIDDARMHDLLGSQEAQAIDKILAQDRGKQPQVGKISGLEFFRIQSVEIQTRTPGPVGIDAHDPKDYALRVLQESVDSGDHQSATFLLETGIYSKVLPSNRPAVAEWLFKRAMSIEKDSLEKISFAVLQQLHRAVPLQLVQSVLLELGADPELLKSAGMDINSHIPPKYASAERRTKILQRLVSFIEQSASNGAYLCPETICHLLLVGLDRSTGSVLRSSIIIAMDAISTGLTSTQELNICHKILSLGSQLSPTNQSLMLSLLGGGCSVMARWVATGCLLGSQHITKESLSQSVPVEEIMQLLTSDSKFAINDTTDYEDLLAHVSVLSVMLNDVQAQVLLDKTNGLKAENSVLESVHKQLNVLYGRIVDNRAANLDRSRAKSALHALSMRVHFETLAILGQFSGSYPKKPQHRQITEFFSKH